MNEKHTVWSLKKENWKWPFLVILMISGERGVRDVVFNERPNADHGIVGSCNETDALPSAQSNTTVKFKCKM